MPVKVLSLLEEHCSLFAVGHMAIAYLLGKGSAKPLHVKFNIPLLLVLSILPDIDIFYDFLTGAQLHRGPTHSIVVAALVFVPFFIIYRKKAIPYFLALISHSLIADFFIGGQLQLFWPLSNGGFGFHELGGYYISIFYDVNLAAELILFAIAMAILYKSGDWKVFFTNHKSNLVLIIPILTVLLPTTVGYPFSQSLFASQDILLLLLALAHLFLLVLFGIAVLKVIVPSSKKEPAQPKVESVNPREEASTSILSKSLLCGK